MLGSPDNSAGTKESEVTTAAAVKSTPDAVPVNDPLGAELRNSSFGSSLELDTGKQNDTAISSSLDKPQGPSFLERSTQRIKEGAQEFWEENSIFVKIGASIASVTGTVLVGASIASGGSIAGAIAFSVLFGTLCATAGNLIDRCL